MDGLMRQVDPNLLEAMALVERKFTRLTLVAASGFMMAWLPFCLLCMWELATPPDEIPTSMTFFICFMQSKVKGGIVSEDTGGFLLLQISKYTVRATS